MPPVSKHLLVAVMLAALAVPSAALANDERDDPSSSTECPAPTLRTADGDDGCPKPPCPPATTRNEGGGESCPKPECPVATTRPLDGERGSRCVKPKPECPAPTADVRAARSERCGDEGR